MIFHIFPCFPSSNISRTATRDRELHVSAIVRSNQQPELQGLISWSHKKMGPSGGQKMSPMSRSYRFFGFRLGLTRVARNSMLDHWQIGKSITLLNNSTGFRSCARLEAAQVTSVSDAGKLILGFMGHPEFVRPTYYRLQESVQLQVRPTAFRGKGTNVFFGYVMIQSCFALLLCIGAHIQGTLLFFACNDKFGDCPPLFFFTN